MDKGLKSLIALGLIDFGPKDELIIGHGDFRYTIDVNWGALNPQYYPVHDCHEMAMDKNGRIFLLTNHTKNNVLIYDYWGSARCLGYRLSRCPRVDAQR